VNARGEGADAVRRFHATSPLFRDGFTSIPNVVLRRIDLSGNAKALYAIVLDLVQYQREEPDMQGLGELIGAGEKAAKAALKQLVDAGLLEVKRRGLGRTNAYFLVDPEPVPSGDVLNRPQGGSRNDVGEEPTRAGDPSSSKKRSDPTGQTPEGEGDQPPRVVTIDGRNLPLDALVEECHVDAASPRMGETVVALNGRKGDPGIRHLFWTEASRWATENGQIDRLEELLDDPEKFALALEAAIRRKAAKYREAMPGATLTPGALRKWWLDVELAGRAGGGMSPDEIERFGNAA
jgi:hypothetical protein